MFGRSARDDKWSLAENRIVSGSERDHFHFLKSHRDNHLHLGGEGGERSPAGGGQGGLGRGQQGGGEVGLGRAGGRGGRGEDLKMVQVDFSMFCLNEATETCGAIPMSEMCGLGTSGGCGGLTIT